MSLFKTLSLEKFKHYLYQGRLEESFDFFQDGTLRLHWSNDARLRAFFKERAQVEERLNFEINHKLQELQAKSIWLWNRRALVETTLHELYQAYSNPLLLKTLFKKSGEDQLSFSAVSRAGPYQGLGELNWFNQDDYRHVVYLKLLTGQLPERSFRLSVSLPFRFCRDSRPLERIELLLTQITAAGLLFKLPPEHRWVQDRGMVRETLHLFHLKSFTFRAASCSQLRGLAQALQQHSKQFVSESALTAKFEMNGRECVQPGYLFLRFEDLEGEAARDLVSFFKDLMELAHETTGSLLKEVA